MLHPVLDVEVPEGFFAHDREIGQAEHLLESGEGVLLQVPSLDVDAEHLAKEGRQFAVHRSATASECRGREIFPEELALERRALRL